MYGVLLVVESFYCNFFATDAVLRQIEYNTMSYEWKRAFCAPGSSNRWGFCHGGLVISPITKKIEKGLGAEVEMPGTTPIPHE